MASAVLIVDRYAEGVRFLAVLWLPVVAYPDSNVILQQLSPPGNHSLMLYLVRIFPRVRQIVDPHPMI